MQSILNFEVIIMPERITHAELAKALKLHFKEKIETKGDILFRTKSNLDVETDTTDYPRTYDLIRLRLKKLVESFSILKIFI